MNRGIVLVSIGHAYYIRMAYQLAFSIKANESVSITLISNNYNVLNEDQRNVFDNIIHHDSKNGLRVKTNIYNLSPYDETIYLDVDMLALNINSFTKLFDELKDIDFTVACRGKSESKDWSKKTSMWADLTSYKDRFPNGLWYQLSSEFIYFKKSDKIKKLFDDANKQYDEIRDFNLFGNTMADEFAFGISCCINEIYPHKENFTPIYWAHAEKRPMREIDPYINEGYYGYSMGGKTSHPKQQDYYINMLKYYQQKSKSRIDIFVPKSKNYYLPERHTI